ncbi:MAG: endonuclease/exonuclease/phosphatase family protein [Verrucomicrobia bacterium]|nr:endonuclease/exonuclease/phosphatase family protein [Verrucomicrobiota bacterium]
MRKFTPWILCLVACSGCQAAQLLPIGRIQGIAHRSPYAGEIVEAQGIVTQVDKNGFCFQSKSPDASPETSDAMYVYQKNTEVHLGNEVRVKGRVEEWTPGGEDSYNLSITQIRAVAIRRIRSKAPLPKPVVLNYLMPDYPKIIKQPGSAYDPTINALDFWESLELMRVVIMDASIVGPKSRYGEIAVRIPQGLAEPRTPRGGVKLTGYEFNPARILVALDPESELNYSTGDRLSTPIQGIITYSFGNYKVTATSRPEPPYTSSIAAFSISDPLPDSAFKLATFNVENLYPELPDEKFRALGKIIAQSLQAPDIVALQEIQDNSGPKNDGEIGADQALDKLIRFILEAGGPRYSYHQLNPEENADGGWAGGNIRNAYLYKKESMRLGKSYHLKNPVFDKNKDRDYYGTRKPLVGFFQNEDRQLILINCHLNSKGRDSSSFGALLPAVRFSEPQRIAQTRVIRAHVDELRQKYPNAGVIVLGDMNDFEFSPAIQNLTGNQGLINLVNTVPLANRYTYIHQGFSQVLDHILVSPDLAGKLATQIVHVNADLSEALRASDHDPILAWFTNW